MSQQHHDPALVLAHLILHGLALEPPEGLPPEWQLGYEAARHTPGGMYERRQAFRNAIQDSPQVDQLNAEYEAAARNLRDLPAVGQNRVVSAWETLSDPPATEWLVEGAFTTPSLTLLVGDPGAKKSFLALDLAVCIAAGTPWLGRTVGTGLKPVPVLYIDEESGFHTMWSRLNSAMRGHQAPPRIPLHYISLAGYNLRNSSEADLIANRASLLGARFIIIDALANVTHGADENNVLSVQPVFTNLRRVAQASKAAVLVIHHTNKHGIFRGSTSISAGVDHMLIVESKANDSLINLRTLKSRNIAPIALTARANFEDGKFWLSPEADKLVAEISPLAHDIINFLTKKETATTDQIIAGNRGLTPGYIRQLIHELQQTGVILRANDGTKGTPAIYKLAIRGEQE